MEFEIDEVCLAPLGPVGTSVVDNSLIVDVNHSQHSLPIDDFKSERDIFALAIDAVMTNQVMVNNARKRTMNSLALLLQGLIMRHKRQLQNPELYKNHPYFFVGPIPVEKKKEEKKSRIKNKGIRGTYCVSNQTNSIIGSILEEKDDYATRVHIRISNQAFFDLCKRLRKQKKRHGWKWECEVIFFLYWLATGSSYQLIATTFSIPLSSVRNIVHRLLNQVTELLSTVVKLPGADETETIGLGFAALGKSHIFGKAAGAIDGCHVKVLCPKHLHDDYTKRKLSYSVQLQGVVDDRCRFIDVFIDYPDSVHDTSVLTSSYLYKNSAYPPAGYFLLGDSGFPCISNPIMIITPFKEPLASTVEGHFNQLHGFARTPAERAFGMLKVRWRGIFTKTSKLSLKRAPKVLAACVALHNLCLEIGDVLDEEIPAIGPPKARPKQNDDLNALHFRASLALSLSRVNNESAPQAIANQTMHVREHDYMYMQL